MSYFPMILRKRQLHSAHCRISLFCDVGIQAGKGLPTNIGVVCSPETRSSWNKAHCNILVRFFSMALQMLNEPSLLHNGPFQVDRGSDRDHPRFLDG